MDVFNCKPVYPERDLSGEWLEKLTAVQGAQIKGIHLALPGYEEGPTLEIFGYNKTSGDDEQTPLINAFGLTHIAFHVENVKTTLDKLVAHGGKTYGELVEKDYEKIGIVTVVYATDPEGNIIEIQNWRKV
jgi:catechol 2,3-dioxygenase-like lactoylglutathione lyase family enzyme